MLQIQITQEIAKTAAMDAWGWFQNKVQEKGDLSFSGTAEAYGVLLEEFHELVEAVRSNDHVAVRKEVKDIFVPCLFELASAADRERVKHRITVSQTMALSRLTHLQTLLLYEKTCTSIHHILGRVAMEFRFLEANLVDYPDARLIIEHLAVACLLALASFDSGKMDW